MGLLTAWTVRGINHKINFPLCISDNAFQLLATLSAYPTLSSYIFMLGHVLLTLTI